MPARESEGGTRLGPPVLTPRRRRRVYGLLLLVGLVATGVSIAADPQDWLDSALRLGLASLFVCALSRDQPPAPCLHVDAEGLTWGEHARRLGWALVEGVEVRRRPRVLRLLGVRSTIRVTDRPQLDFAERAGTRPVARRITPADYAMTRDEVLDVLERHADARVRAQLLRARAGQL